jgi:hypothetical protein
MRPPSPPAPGRTIARELLKRLNVRTDKITVSSLTPFLSAGLVLAATTLYAQFPPGGRVLESKQHHLGREKLETPWPGVSAKPDALKLDLRFDSRSNGSQWVVGIRQHDVTERTLLLLNGKEIAHVKLNTEPGVFFYPIAAGRLQDGENRLTVAPTKPRDNMVIGPIHLYEQPLRALKDLQQVTVSVSDAATGKPVPARLTLVDSEGNHAELFSAESTHTAVRLGTLYTMGTPASFEMDHGEYTIYATRGMEWSRAEARLTVARDKPANLALSIRREVDTTGFIAADTHIHTLTFSGHGDSSVEERVVTLAGEGVELAIATDHNHNTDYRPMQIKLSMQDFFTAVTGNEVSTPVGHFNGFPLDPAEPPPAHKLNDWVQIVDGMRGKGAKVVILNHPRGLVFPRYAFNLFPVNRASGEFPNTGHFPFDAIELTNPSGNFEPLYLLQDWFALLNYGRKVTAVSASDSHTVGDPVGWWRSYVPSATDDPAKIDVDDACNRYLKGETSASLGIFTDVRVDDKYTMGQTYSPKKNTVAVRVRVAAPSWVQPRKALVFLNGRQVGEQPVPDNQNKATDLWLTFSVPLPKHDAHLVCAVIGDGIEHAMLPAGKTKNGAFTWAVANPVYLDCDGDGKYSSPRETGRIALNRAGKNAEQQWKSIASADDVIAVQMVSLLREQTAEAAPRWMSGFDTQRQCARRWPNTRATRCQMPRPPQPGNENDYAIFYSLCSSRCMASERGC